MNEIHPGGLDAMWASGHFGPVGNDLPDGDEIPEPPKTDPIPEDEVPADVPEPEGD